MKTLRFHTGRGGRFYSQGHVTFTEFEKIQGSVAFAELFLNGDILTDDSGNELDYEINRDGTGYVSCDGDYDTDTWVNENNLTPNQINALVDCWKHESHWDQEEIHRILTDHYPFYLDEQS